MRVHLPLKGRCRGERDQREESRKWPQLLLPVKGSEVQETAQKGGVLCAVRHGFLREL